MIQRDDLVNRLFEAVEETYKHGRVKYGDSWTDSHPDYPYRRTEEEHMELRQAVEHYQDRNKAIRELADYVNYAVMYIALSTPQTAPGGTDSG